jgi:hypothetical protein
MVGDAGPTLSKGFGIAALDGSEGLPVPFSQIDFAQLRPRLGDQTTARADDASGFCTSGEVAAHDGLQSSGRKIIAPGLGLLAPSRAQGQILLADIVAARICYLNLSVAQEKKRAAGRSAG